MSMFGWSIQDLISLIKLTKDLYDGATNKYTNARSELRVMIEDLNSLQSTVQEIDEVMKEEGETGFFQWHELTLTLEECEEVVKSYRDKIQSENKFVYYCHSARWTLDKQRIARLQHQLDRQQAKIMLRVQFKLLKPTLEAVRHGRLKASNLQQQPLDPIPENVVQSPSYHSQLRDILRNLERTQNILKRVTYPVPHANRVSIAPGSTPPSPSRESYGSISSKIGARVLTRVEGVDDISLEGEKLIYIIRVQLLEGHAPISAVQAQQFISRANMFLERVDNLFTRDENAIVRRNRTDSGFASASDFTVEPPSPGNVSPLNRQSPWPSISSPSNTTITTPDILSRGQNYPEGEVTLPDPFYILFTLEHTANVISWDAGTKYQDVTTEIEIWKGFRDRITRLEFRGGLKPWSYKFTHATLRIPHVAKFPYSVNSHTGKKIYKASFLEREPIHHGHKYKTALELEFGSKNDFKHFQEIIFTRELVESADVNEIKSNRGDKCLFVRLRLWKKDSMYSILFYSNWKDHHHQYIDLPCGLITKVVKKNESKLVLRLKNLSTPTGEGAGFNFKAIGRRKSSVDSSGGSEHQTRRDSVLSTLSITQSQALETQLKDINELVITFSTPEHQTRFGGKLLEVLPDTSTE